MVRIRVMVAWELMMLVDPPTFAAEKYQSIKNNFRRVHNRVVSATRDPLRVHAHDE